jgi:hypothetical protein
MSSEGYEIFEAWLNKFKSQIEKGEEVTIPVKDNETFEKITVRGKIGKEALPGAVPLKIVSDLGEKRGSLYIKILEEMDELSSAAVES